MWKQYFADHQAVPFGLVAMVIFMTLFVISVIYAMRKPKAELGDVARLPLTDDDLMTPPLTAPFNGRSTGVER